MSALEHCIFAVSVCVILGSLQGYPEWLHCFSDPLEGQWRDWRTWVLNAWFILPWAGVLWASRLR